MAEYYPLLARAVANLPSSTPETRRAIYERARKALMAQLQKIEPPIAPEDISREEAALTQAVDRLEAEVAAKPSIASPAPPSASPSPPPALGERASKPAPALTPRPAPTATPAAPPIAVDSLAAVRAPAPGATPLPPPPLVRPPTLRPPAPRPPGAGAAWPPAISAPTRVEPAASRALEPAVARDEPSRSDLANSAPEAAVAIDAASVAAPSSFDRMRAFGRPRNETEAAEDGVGVEEAGPNGEPRVEALRPAAPVAARASGFDKRVLVFLALVVLVMGGIGALAYKLRERPEDFARPRVAETGDSSGGKISERAGDDKASSPIVAPSQRQAPAQQTPPQQTQALQQPTPSAGPTPTPASPSDSSAVTALPVAQRAALLIEAPDEASKVRTYVGTVVWSLAQGPDNAPVLRAVMDVPDAKLNVVMTMSKMSDPSSASSHRIELRFTTASDGLITGIRQVATPEMRAEDRSQGDVLNGLPAQVTPTVYWIALAKGDDVTRRNLDLMANRGWLDVPILLDTGRVAKITMEKGAIGDQLMRQAFQAWGDSAPSTSSSN